MQLPAELRNAVTAAAVQLVKASRGGVDQATLDRFAYSTVVDLWNKAARDDYGMPIWHALTAALIGIAGQCADGWDAAAADTPASGYLAEVAALAGHERE